MLALELDDDALLGISPLRKVTKKMRAALRPRMLPLATFAALGTSLYLFGYSGRSSAAVAALGLVVSFAGSFLQPTPVLAPAGGTHHVGVRHLSGHRATGMPSASVFYPTNCAPVADEPWLPHGDIRYAHGMAAHAHLPRFLLSYHQSVRLKVTRNASLLSLRLPTGGFRPLIVLSHGLAAHHHAYACVAMDLAARGAIVFCLQHGDGSTSFSREGEEPDMEVIMYRKLQPSENEVSVRESQLQTRVKEVFRLLSAIENGSVLHKMFCSSNDMQAFLAHDEVRIILAGHSFGAATALASAVRLLEQRDATGACSHVPDRVQISHVICNDLWHLPLSFVCPLLDANRKLVAKLPPLLLQESVHWERWSENKNFEVELVRTLGTAAPFVQRVVMDGTDHMSFSDIGVLSPVVSRKKYARGSSRKKITAFASQLLNFVSSRTGASK